MLERTLRLPLAAVAAALLPGALAAPAVTCRAEYGGETQRVTAQPASSPYDVAAVPVGRRFSMRVVVQGEPAEMASVRVYTYSGHAPVPTLIHLAAYPWPVSSDPARRHGFTGLQKVYEPGIGAELQYWCHAGAEPEPAAAAPGTTATEPAVPERGAAALRVVFAGDVMLARAAGRAIAAGGDPLRHVAPVLRSGDYAIGNLESAIATAGTPHPGKPYAYRAHPRVLRVLKQHFDALSVANNHSGDYGPAAFEQTLDLIGRAGIQAFGGGRNLPQAHRPLWLERGGLRVAVLGYDEFLPRAFEAGPSWPGVAWSEDVDVVADIRAARAAGANVVIPFLHWGWENQPQASPRQRQLAQAMIDAGADAVVGAHPHVTQGADLYRGRPIVWSLGNLVFDGFASAAARLGWVLRMSLDAHGVVAWDTVRARIDAAGAPHPEPGAASPCGRRGEPAVGDCTPGPDFAFPR